MVVRRIWFISAPTGVIDSAKMAEMAVGYYLEQSTGLIVNVAECLSIEVEVEDNIKHARW